MIYKNDREKYKDYNKELNKKVMMFFIPLTIIGIIPVYTTIYKEEKVFLILIITLIGVLISGFIGLYFGSKKSKKIFESAELIVYDNRLKYTDIEKNIEISTQEIKSIQKDNDGNLSILSNNGDSFKITKYVVDHNGLLSKLEGLSEIKDRKNYSKIISNLPLIFFLGVMVSKYIPYLQFYIFFGIGYIFLTIWSILTNLRSIIKKPTLILINGILIYICYIVGKAIYTIIIR